MRSGRVYEDRGNCSLPPVQKQVAGAWPAPDPLDRSMGKNRQAVSAIFDVLRPTKALNPVIPTGFCQDIVKPW
jgi:hypothetical protein